MNRDALLNLSAYMGIIFAPVLAIAETIHNWGDWSNPAFWIIDYVACALVFAGAMDWLRSSKIGVADQKLRCVALLTGGWGFACAMLWMAFFLYLQNYQFEPETVDPIELVFVSGLFLWAIIGFSLSLTAIIKTGDD